MAYDEAMADRIRTYFARHPDITERRMFGGVGWMVAGHMAAGAHPDGRLMVRCSREDYPARLEEPGAHALIHGGRTMTGFVLVDAAQIEDDDALEAWLDRAHAFAASQPPKKSAK